MPCRVSTERQSRMHTTNDYAPVCLCIRTFILLKPTACMLEGPPTVRHSHLHDIAVILELRACILEGCAVMRDCEEYDFSSAPDPFGQQSQSPPVCLRRRYREVEVVYPLLTAAYEELFNARARVATHADLVCVPQWPKYSHACIQ